MSDGLKVYRFINTISIDVAAGASVCCWFFARQFESDISSLHYGLLFLIVWIIYTTDHLLDARRTTTIASTFRHQFHQRHYRILRVVLVVVIIIAAFIAFYLPGIVLKNGIILSVFVLLYLLFQYRLAYLKELMGGLFYSMGVLLPLFPLQEELSFVNTLLIVQFLLTVWINLLLFSLFDKEHDFADSHSSFATAWGEKSVYLLTTTLFIICTGLTAYQLLLGESWASLTIFLMDLTLLVVLIGRNYFAQYDRFRLVGDLVFLYPLLVWIVDIMR